MGNVPLPPEGSPWPAYIPAAAEILQVADPVAEAERRRRQIGYEIQYDGRPSTSQQ